MQINPLIFRNYDIRGVVDVDLDDEKIEAIGKAYGTFLRRRKIRQMVCGRDCRLTGEAYQKAFTKGVVTTGVDVIDIGLVMTQMMYFAQYRFQTNGGAIMTASHNPKNFNGFKLAIGYSQTTGPEEVQEIRKIVEGDNYFISDVVGKVTKADIREDYINDVLKRVDIKHKFKVVVDTHCGTTGLYNFEIFRRAGCEVIEMNPKVDGSFPMGTPDPTDARLMNKIAKVVLENKADLGLAFDGDGDRIGLVDEKGQVLWNDVAVAIFAKEILERFPGSKIVYNTLCSQVVREVVRINGGTPIIWNTGHAFIKAKIAAEKAAFGGELSGHFFFADNAYGHDDGTYAALRILEYLSEKNLSLSQLYESFPQYISSPEIKIGCPDEKKIGVINELSMIFKKDFPKAVITDNTVIPGDDGVRADFDDGMMVFRYSQNGPYITIKFEAKTQEIFEQRRTYVREMLERFPDMVWEDQLCINLDFIK
jgi:phosphomannomutase/phosphoglucomutase